MRKWEKGNYQNKKPEKLGAEVFAFRRGPARAGGHPERRRPEQAGTPGLPCKACARTGHVGVSAPSAACPLLLHL